MVDAGLAELHTHLGASVASDILWSLAHEQGIALPVKDYWEFDRLVTIADPRGVANLDALDAIYHWTELIQSSPLAVERSVHAAIGGAYRSQRITTFELRFNPMKRNRGGERDLVGIDIAGPRPDGGRYDYAAIAPLVEEAREAGLGVTIHVGEEGGETGRDEVREVVEALHPDRIGHGILAAGDPELMAALRDAEIVLEICPTSNLLTKALRDEDEVRETFRAFVDNGVQFTIATDGPEMMGTHLRDEFDLLVRIGALGEDELAEANARGHEASFVRGAPVAA